MLFKCEESRVKSEVTKQKEWRESRGNKEAKKDKSRFVSHQLMFHHMLVCNIWKARVLDNQLPFIFLKFMLQIKWICPTAPTRPVALFGVFLALLVRFNS